MSKILGTADPATGKRTKGTDPRMRGAGRGRTTRATRGKMPPPRRGAAGRPSGLSRVLGSLTGRR